MSKKKFPFGKLQDDNEPTEQDLYDMEIAKELD